MISGILQTGQWQAVYDDDAGGVLRRRFWRIKLGLRPPGQREVPPGYTGSANGPVRILLINDTIWMPGAEKWEEGRETFRDSIEVHPDLAVQLVSITSTVPGRETTHYAQYA